jgi:hypothetical protein
LKKHFSIDLLSHDLMLFFLYEAIFPLDYNVGRIEDVFHVDDFKNLEKPSVYSGIYYLSTVLLRFVQAVVV